MNLIRGLIFDNLGLKLVALLLAVVVYLHVFTSRPATMIISFPLQIADLSDSLAISGPVPPALEAELRGTGKQFIRLWLTEPRIKVSLAGVGRGRFNRSLSEDDLPLMASDRLEVVRLVGPRTLSVRIEPKSARVVALTPRIEGAPKAGAAWDSTVVVEPASVLVRGPQKVVASLSGLELETVRIDGRSDTVRVKVGVRRIPDGCTVEPASVMVTVPLTRSRL